jgi:tetratricopeptide (TPR) repeat protein
MPDMADDSLQSLLNHAAELRRAGDSGAVAAYERLLALHPQLPDSWYNLGILQRQARLFDEALESYHQAIRRGLDEPEVAHLNRGVIFSDDLRRPNDAERELRAALKINPRFMPAMLNLGNLLEDRGRREEALQSYLDILAINPNDAEALARAASLRPALGPGDPAVVKLAAGLSRKDLDHAARASLAFALGKVLDDVGSYEEAFAAYRGANRLSQASAPNARYDRAAQETFVDALITAFPTGITPAPVAGDERPPIFICGMFRSGSTLVEQVLASHSQVTSGGELDLLPAIVEESLSPYPAALDRLTDGEAARLAESYLGNVRRLFPDADVVTDKRPENFVHVGLIKRLMPGARIVNTLRNPLDNVISVYFLHLHTKLAYALQLEDIAHYLVQERRLMAHWKSLWPDDILDLDYDAFVQDPRPLTEKLLTFCGLDWEDACLDFHLTDSNVRTASVWQVREPLYKRSSGRWLNYEKPMQPVKAWLEGQGVL